MAKAIGAKGAQQTKSGKSGTGEVKVRHSIRFTPDPLTTALIELKNNSTFKPSLVALVLNESFTGCALVLSCDQLLKKDQILKVKVGNLNPMMAKIIWVKHLEENIFKIGLKFN